MLPSGESRGTCSCPIEILLRCHEWMTAINSAEKENKREKELNRAIVQCSSLYLEAATSTARAHEAKTRVMQSQAEDHHRRSHLPLGRERSYSDTPAGDKEARPLLTRCFYMEN